MGGETQERTNQGNRFEGGWNCSSGTTAEAGGGGEDFLQKRQKNNQKRGPSRRKEILHKKIKTLHLERENSRYGGVGFRREHGGFLKVGFSLRKEGLGCLNPKGGERGPLEGKWFPRGEKNKNNEIPQASC